MCMFHHDFITPKITILKAIPHIKSRTKYVHCFNVCFQMNRFELQPAFANVASHCWFLRVVCSKNLYFANDRLLLEFRNKDVFDENNVAKSCR